VSGICGVMTTAWNRDWASVGEAAITAARAIGYQTIYLDTLPTMDQAAALYSSLGFRDIPPYYDSPLRGTRCMKRELL
jgi:putative acetyltransferase